MEHYNNQSANGFDHSTALDTLKAFDQWVVWKKWYDPERGKWTKPPHSAKTGFKCSATDSKNWVAYQEAVEKAAKLNMDGVGFALSPDDDITGVDLDNCIDPFDNALPWAQEILDLAETYAERSPSDNGIRLFVRGKVPSATKYDPAGVEIYGTNRYLTVTGRHIAGTPNAINPAPKTIALLLKRVAQLKAENEPAQPEIPLSERARAKAPQPSNPWRAVNDLAFNNLGDWVPELFPTATYQAGTKAWRIASADLGRDLQEDLSIAPSGAIDFGVHDMGDPREGKRTAIDLVMEFSDPALESPYKAAEWLCARLGTSVLEMGFDASEAGFQAAEDMRSDGKTRAVEHPEPQPLSPALMPVPRFNTELLPDGIQAWVIDIAKRMQCPVDFVAVAAMTGLGAVVGRKVAIKPNKHDEWFVVPNIWGAVVGRPGVMKSPAMEAALKPLHKLEATAREQNEFAMEKYRKELAIAEMKLAAKKKAAQAALKTNPNADVDLTVPMPDAPCPKRLLVTDATYEKLGVIAEHNPNGVLYYRDELMSLLRYLQAEENVSARSFFLSSWSGTSSYLFDRMSRADVFIPALCVSVLGSTQPGPLADLIFTSQETSEDDGMLQRFQLLVWPDTDQPYVKAELGIDAAARDEAYAVFDRLATLTASSVHADCGDYDPLPWLAFSAEALGPFKEWHVALENRLRGDTIKNSGLESHLSKYRKLVPALALLIHIVEGNHGPVTLAALKKALGWAEYLEAHAVRAYESTSDVEVRAAKAIIEKIKAGKLTGEFTVRQLTRHKWAGLTNAKQVKLGVDYLVDTHWLVPASVQKNTGRPSDRYSINPKALTAAF